jgi:hypothetical protein
VGAVDAPVPCLAASVADMSKGAGALSVTLTLVVEVIACAGVGVGARRLSAVAVRSLLPCLLLGWGWLRTRGGGRLKGKLLVGRGW